MKGVNERGHPLGQGVNLKRVGPREFEKGRSSRLHIKGVGPEIPVFSHREPSGRWELRKPFERSQGSSKGSVPKFQCSATESFPGGGS